MNSRELVFLVLGMVTVLVFVEKDSQFFPVFLLLWKRIHTLVAC